MPMWPADSLGTLVLVSDKQLIILILGIDKYGSIIIGSYV